MSELIILRDVFLLLLYTLTSIFALISNGIVFRVIFRRGHHLLFQSTIHFPLSTTRILLLNLALADTLLAVTIPIQFISCSTYFLNHFSISSYICILNRFMQVLGYNASTVTICLIAYDRYRLIRNPLSKYYEPKLFRSLLSTWILSSLFSASCLLSTKSQIYFPSTRTFIGCQILLPTIAKDFSNGYILKRRIFCAMISFYIIPLVTVTILCVLTMRVIFRRSTIGVQRFQSFKQTRRRSLVLLLMTAIAFALSRTPIYLVHLHEFLIASSKTSPTRSVRASNLCNYSTLYLLFYWLSISSCCHNPIIYNWFNRRFRLLVVDCYRSILYCGK
ncbi:unnamed protein product [Adineta ricciae]|uniref:G-protein coupled receptors family 1 profile domain-containing protein n=1 Tax=Adineta ricciae TaxID=249248 RepID=A0A814BLP3_ADIRI|nr:unnamed protein product [Adineta ricciae]CAF0976656.1 unnamed protein product [Adineta ricciae]